MRLFLSESWDRSILDPSGPSRAYVMCTTCLFPPWTFHHDPHPLCFGQIASPRVKDAVPNSLERSPIAHTAAYPQCNTQYVTIHSASS